MRLPRFRLRTLMIVVGLSAIAMVGVADVLSYYRIRNHFEVVSERQHSDGSLSMTLLSTESTYFLGAIPLGPCPGVVLTAVICGVSVVVWVVRHRKADGRDRDTRE